MAASEPCRGDTEVAPFAEDVRRLVKAGDRLANLLSIQTDGHECRAAVELKRDRTLDSWCSDCAALEAWETARNHGDTRSHHVLIASGIPRELHDEALEILDQLKEDSQEQ